MTVTSELRPLAVVYGLEDFEIQHNKAPKLEQLIVHPLAIFFRNLHLVFFCHFLTLNQLGLKKHLTFVILNEA